VTLRTLIEFCSRLIFLISANIITVQQRDILCDPVFLTTPLEQYEVRGLLKHSRTSLRSYLIDCTLLCSMMTAYRLDDRSLIPEGT
jgi:hypothetical protein